MTFEPGDVVWHEAPYKSTRSDGTSPQRPWLVVSNDSHPFQGTEYVVLGMTTSGRQNEIAVEERHWRVGGTSKRGHVSPWYAMTLKHRSIAYRVGTVAEEIVDRAVDELQAYLGYSA